METFLINQSIPVLPYYIYREKSIPSLRDYGGIMREKIIKEALAWYEQQKNNPDIEDFVEFVIGKTTDNILEYTKKMVTKKNDWKNPFGDGKTSKKIIKQLIET